jgi:16S rRNA (cytosine967-C5)-methyltransferase
MRNQGVIVACDASKRRLARLSENLMRLGVEIAQIFQVDWTRTPVARPPGKPFDRILIDAPCSNTGVIRRRVDVRWRLTSEDFPRMHETQLGLIRATAPLLKEGGTLVYSTCSIEPEENEQVVDFVQRTLPELKFVESRQTLPFRDRSDGAFAAKFVRIKSPRPSSA